MSRGVNKVILIGNLGRDPEVRHNPNGKSMASLSVGTDSSFKRDGEWKSQTEWHRVIVFGNTVKVVEQYLSKGEKVYVEGRLQTRKWNKDGVETYTTEVVCMDLQLLGKASRKNHDGESAIKNNSEKYGDMDGEDDDLPF
jgi:single-strand DNA-binding protein